MCIRDRAYLGVQRDHTGHFRVPDDWCRPADDDFAQPLDFWASVDDPNFFPLSCSGDKNGVWRSYNEEEHYYLRGADEQAPGFVYPKGQNYLPCWSGRSASR
eukprot:4330550-Alexandrium_andersonii.AAC.1